MVATGQSTARRAVAATLTGALVVLAGCTSSGGDTTTAAPTGDTGVSSTAAVPATTPPSGSGPSATDGSTGTTGTTTSPSGGGGPTTSTSTTPPGGPTGTPPSINGPGGAGSSGAPHGRPSGTAVDAFRAWTADWNGGRYRDMYSALPATQQAQVRYRQFAQCQRDQTQQVGATSVVYQRTLRQRHATVSGNPGVEITARIYFDGFSPVTTERTLVWYADGAAWRWGLTSGALRSYRHGTCPR